MPIPEIVSVAKAKAHLSELLKETKGGRVFEIINRSEAVAIVMDVAQYRLLLEKIEDLEDAVAVLQGDVEDQGKRSIPWERAKEEYWAEHPAEARGV